MKKMTVPILGLANCCAKMIGRKMTSFTLCLTVSVHLARFSLRKKGSQVQLCRELVHINEYKSLPSLAWALSSSPSISPAVAATRFVSWLLFCDTFGRCKSANYDALERQKLRQYNLAASGDREANATTHSSKLVHSHD